MSRAWPHEIPDAYGLGARLFIRPGDGPDLAEVRTGGGRPVAVDDLPPLVAALYAAAGKPEPVILGRPTGPVDRFRGIKTRRDGDSVLLSIGGNRDALDPDAARSLAAELAILADEAESKPDPAEVEELTGVLVQAGAGLRPTGVDDIARAALRWMRDKQRGESRDG